MNQTTHEPFAFPSPAPTSGPSVSGGGGIGLAARILWLTLKLQWQKGINALQVAWLRFKQAFLEVAHAAFFGALAAMEIAWHGIEVAFIETSAFLSKVWTKFTAGFRKTWNTAVNWVAKRLVELQGLADSSFDSDEAKRLLDQDLQADNRGIDNQRDSALSDAEEQRQPAPSSTKTTCVSRPASSAIIRRCVLIKSVPTVGAISAEDWPVNGFTEPKT